MVTFVNKLTVHGDVEEFLAAKDRVTAYMCAQPGYLGHQTLRLSGGAPVFLELAQWQDAAAHRAAVTHPDFQALVGGLRGLATPEPGLYEVLADRSSTPAEPVTAGAR
ncbi:antibiotic biosynthesis monooxygenase family protein [Streptomyces sp. NPDC050145]|uniref:antibiotic biosynthesis monooxygenase family protein n=1 Tax=Streptomyces sp. NPDC050145 TaxID=3365602 RepID=UPI00379D9312